MKKKYFKLIFLSLFLTSINIELSAQDKIKKSKIGSNIISHLVTGDFDLSKTDIQNLYIDSQYITKKTGITHVYLGQKHNGIKVFNSISSIALKDDKVFYVGNSFTDNIDQKVNSITPSLTNAEAIQIAAKKFKFKINELKLVSSTNNSYVFDKGDDFLENINVNLVYYKLNEVELKLAWNLNLYQLDGKHNWSVKVDALTGDILDNKDLVITCDFGSPDHKNHNHDKDIHHLNHEENTSFELFKNTESSLVYGAEYNVYALPAESPNHVGGTAAGRTLVSDVENLNASPYGWHDTDGIAGADYTITRGNNAHAYDDSSGNGSSQGDEPDGGSSLSFDYPADLTKPPTANNAFVGAFNKSANITNVFYMTNMMHDIYYNYGFDEAAGNFQQNNYGNGGLGGDYVLVEAQDGGGTNNANFSTPADGNNSRMQMYLWTSGNPQIDGDLDNGIIAHEFGHGIHTRLGGGPNNSGCMQNDEQQGEGWADWFGLMVTIEPGDLGTDARGIGTFAQNQPITGGGIRPYRYSTNTSVNPQTYDGVKVESIPHGVGSVWCTMLWDLTWAYINKYGFDSDLYNGTGGNNKVMQLVLDGLKLQPCSSGFVDSRDAILAADVATTGGIDQCLIWEVFAARGLGASADQGSSASRSDGTEAFDMPMAALKANVTPTTCGVDTVDLILTNLDSNLISQFDYNYTIDGGSVLSDSWSGAVNSCSVSSAIPFNFGALSNGTHQITVTGTNPLTANESFIINVNNSGTENVVNTFETDSDNLVSYDDGRLIGTWERGQAWGPGTYDNDGSLTTRVLTTAITSGSNVYSTNLDGVHGNASKFYLTSECYDLSSLENTYVKFDLAFDIEKDWDILYMEYTIDDGVNWLVLGESTDVDWYNSNRTPNNLNCFNCIGKQWTGLGDELATSHSDGGVLGEIHEYSHSLADFDSTGSSEDNIVFRFVYHADEAVSFEGALIDNFVVQGSVSLSIDSNEFEKLSIYPNPTKDEINITSPNTLSDATVTIFDIMGRNLTENIDVTMNNSNSITIDISEFSSGNYILYLEDENFKSVKQIVKY
jgi:extracellular elastinolytic metalloproteinase